MRDRIDYSSNEEGRRILFGSRSYALSHIPFSSSQKEIMVSGGHLVGVEGESTYDLPRH